MCSQRCRACVPSVVRGAICGKARPLLCGLVALALGVCTPMLNAQFEDVGRQLDLWSTPAGNTWVDLDLPPDFFEPGSAAFNERVQFEGDPYGAPWGPTDTIVERLEIADFPPETAPGSCAGSCAAATVDIVIRALNLVSANQIVVMINGVPTQWDVKVCLSDQPQDIGTMTLFHDCPDGGHWTATLPVKAKMIFTPAGGGADIVLDPVIDELSSWEGGWAHSDIVDPAFGVISVAAGLQVDGNCDGVLDPPLAVGSEPPVCRGAVIGITLTPCNCDTPATPSGGPTPEGGSLQSKKLTIEQGAWARHGVLPAEIPPTPAACCCPNGDCDENVDEVTCAINNCSSMPTGSCTGNEACCLIDPLGNPVCVETSPECCIRQNGTPLGLGSVCGATEACCWLFFPCEDIDPICCELYGGDPQGNPSMCLGDWAPWNGIDDACEHICGNGVREGTEACDGADAAACGPGVCLPNCTCVAGVPPCGNGVRDAEEQCDGDDDDLCPGHCSASCVCTPPVGACCGSGGCAETTEEQCEGSSNGTYNGDGTICIGDTCIPTVSAWGLASLLILVLAAGTIVLRRRTAAMTVH